MASFASVSDAVTCAVSVQEAVGEHNRQSPKDEVILRIGLHAGEPIEDDGDLFGTAVQLAARLCAAAGPSEILVSETIRDISSGLGLPFQDLGIIELKGFENGVRVFSIPWAPAERFSMSRVGTWAPLAQALELDVPTCGWLRSRSPGRAR
ncbi:MAG TPA: adenylate/guanylate cyclase domain-containing protein [Jiangellaceae bacterium]|nr:adenylate/guanylate cyclase domain-containing protein [Jiangellaceae bacterium]